MYIEFSDGEFAENKKIDNDTILDLDENGNILGIEIINVSKRLSRDFLSNITVSNI